MRNRNSTLWAAIAGMVLTGHAIAQENSTAKVEHQQAIKRIPLQRFEVPDTSYETVIGIAEISPNVPVGRYTHPGPESGYMLRVGFTLLIDGAEPADSYALPRRFQ